MGKKDKGKDKGAKGKDKGKKGGKAAAAPPAAEAAAASQPKPPPQTEVKEYDPCRYSAESCNEALGCRPNAYPGLLDEPETMAIVGSESGTYDSLCKLIQGGFRCAERVLMMTPWGNYVIFRVKTPTRMVYFVYDGCTCNVNRFRYYDLNIGTAGLLFFKSTHEVLHYIMNSKLKRQHFNRMRKSLVDDICREYGGEFGEKDIRQIC